VTGILLALIIVAAFTFGFCVACWLAMAGRSERAPSEFPITDVASHLAPQDRDGLAPKRPAGFFYSRSDN
jgi:hypothetical protein